MAPGVCIPPRPLQEFPFWGTIPGGVLPVPAIWSNHNYPVHICTRDVLQMVLEKNLLPNDIAMLQNANTPRTALTENSISSWQIVDFLFSASFLDCHRSSRFLSGLVWDTTFHRQRQIQREIAVIGFLQMSKEKCKRILA